MNLPFSEKIAIIHELENLHKSITIHELTRSVLHVVLFLEFLVSLKQ